MTTKHNKDEIKEAVRKHYATAITQKSSCCGPTPAGFDKEAAGRFTAMAGYSSEQLAQAPEEASSFGCGNPVSFIEVEAGQTVLDLGSGAGLDLILASEKVGPSGKVIGLDMTTEMIEACRKNLKQAGVSNAELRLGEMEQMPVADNEVDWIISNCVINLSPEKEKVFSEAFRVLKPGGRMLVSDIVTCGLPDEYRGDMSAWVGCIAGACEEDEYVAMVKQAGFEDVKVVDKLNYTASQLDSLANDACGCGDQTRPVTPAAIDKYAGKVASVKLSARKPM